MAASQLTTLRDLATRTVDESLSSADDFCDGFATLGESHRGVLQHIHEQAQGCLRENATVSAFYQHTACSTIFIRAFVLTRASPVHAARLSLTTSSASSA